MLYGGGLFVKTTLNPDYQDYADRALRFALTQYDRRHGWRGAIANLNGDAGSRTQALAKIRQGQGHPAVRRAAARRRRAHRAEGRNRIDERRTTAPSRRRN
ncbi:MAG: hypothetical protein WDN72_03340 [Alphaproteobacteria bacterium]